MRCARLSALEDKYLWSGEVGHHTTVYELSAISAKERTMRPMTAQALQILLAVTAFPAVALSQVRPCPPTALSADGQAGTVLPCQAPTLSEQYPGDVGMAGDPAVVWAENFEQATVATLAARYHDVTNLPGMTLSNDRPASSTGMSSLRMQSSASGANQTSLFRNLTNGAGGDEEWYVRYYVKYVAGGAWSHTGIWFGGYNPALGYPNPQAGQKPNGDDRFSIALEPASSGSSMRMDFYNYWMRMHSWMDTPSGSGAYYGNTVLHDMAATVPANGWACVELHSRLNTDTASTAGGELGLWLDDASIQQYNQSAPLGYWVRDKFCPDASTDPACTQYRTPGTTLVSLDLQTRSTTQLKLNYLWIQNYVTDAGAVGSVFYDDIVVAKRRIGCIQ